jgi:hypothetical protein
VVSLAVLAVLLGRFRVSSAQADSVVSGFVVDSEGPVEGATVRIQATTNATTSAADGSFTLDGLAGGVPVTVSAWKHTYYCAKVEGVLPPAVGITLSLHHYQTNDNPGYEWMPPTGAESCASCKPVVTEIWLENAHAGAGTNPRFFSLYNGTDVTGTSTIAPGYVLDFPGTAGNCAACHAPGAALDGPFTTDMNALAGADTFGVHCDFCHKVADVYLDPATVLPYRNVPGVLSMDVRRPFPETERFQLFFGTFDDDNVPEEDTYLPLIEKSQFCAPCHQFSFWGTPIYESYQEWLESDYPGMGVECQTCHMPPDGIMTNVAPGAGGVERDPSTIHAHTQPGAADEELLQNTVTMTVSARPVVGQVQVTVTITNTGAGHHVPTDFPGRHMILVLSATDGQGGSMAQYSGPTVPGWGGPEAGLPGKAYAKVLRDVQSGESPVVSYWKQSLIASDNRIPAFRSDTSTYTFAPAPGETITVTAELLFRRAFQHLQDVKGWDAPDILMERAQAVLLAPPRWDVFLPLVLKEGR